MTENDRPTELLCTLGKKNIMNYVTSRRNIAFHDPLFIFLIKYVYTENQTYTQRNKPISQQSTE
jgi:hypothetical protein